MQQAVDLLHTKGRPFDIRALVQKDAAGHWQVTGMAARIAGKGQITTHRPRGGSRARLVPLIRSIFQDEVRTRKITQELHRVILKAVEVFDVATGHNHGELSMDVGLDRTGRPWIFEINSKPAVFDEPSIRRVALASGSCTIASAGEAFRPKPAAAQAEPAAAKLKVGGCPGSSKECPAGIRDTGRESSFPP